MRAERVDLVGLGVVAVDDILYVDSYPEANAKVRIRETHRVGGGRSASALVAASRLGISCRQLGYLGDDEFSHFVRDGLLSHDIDLSCVQYDAEARPLYAMIVVASDTASRAVYVNYDHVRPLIPDELDPHWLAGAKVLLVDNMYEPTLQPALELAQHSGLQTVSDIERPLPGLPEIRKHIDHFVCGIDLARTVSGFDDPGEACLALFESGLHRTVAVTAGDSGCYWIDSSKPVLQHEPAHDVEAVDTTGCGDVFHGVFCAGLIRGWSIDVIMRYANAAGAIKATRRGGWQGSPTLEEIEALLDQATAQPADERGYAVPATQTDPTR